MTKITGEQFASLNSEILDMANTLGLAIDGNISSFTVRRITKCWHTYLYDNPRGNNWYVDTREQGKRKVVLVPYGINNHFPNMTQKVRRGYYLQWCDWAKLDNAINRILDARHLSATFKSSFGLLRKGTKWDEIPERDEHHEFHETDKPIEVN